MQRHPRQKITRFWIGLIFATILFTACKEDACKDNNCQEGICVEGVCACADGYEGENCDAEARLKFLNAAWVNTSICQSNATVLSTSIEPSPANIDRVRIQGLMQSSDIVEASVQEDSLKIEIQVYGTAYVEGLGILNDSTLTIQYDVIQTGGEREDCVSVLTLD